MKEIILDDVKKNIEKNKFVANAYFRSITIFTTFYLLLLFLIILKNINGFEIICFITFVFLIIPYLTFELIKAIRVIEYYQKNSLHKILIDNATLYIFYDSKRIVECKTSDLINLNVYKTGKFFKIATNVAECVILKNDDFEFIISLNELEKVKKEFDTNFNVNKSFLKWYDFIYYTPFLIKTEKGTIIH